MSVPERFHMTSLLMRNPPNGKRVIRGTRWGNPFEVGSPGVPDNATAVTLFRQHLAEHPEKVALGRRELQGFDLGCTCRLDQPCHADVWLEAVNG